MRKNSAQETLTFSKLFLENMDKACQFKSKASAINFVFESEQFWHNEHTKLLKSKSSGNPKADPVIPVLLMPHQKSFKNAKTRN